MTVSMRKITGEVLANHSPIVSFSGLFHRRGLMKCYFLGDKMDGAVNQERKRNWAMNVNLKVFRWTGAN